MVEFETIGIVSIIVGLTSFQFKIINDKLNTEISKADAIHRKLCKKMDKIKTCKRCKN